MVSVARLLKFLERFGWDIKLKENAPLVVRQAGRGRNKEFRRLRDNAVGQETMFEIPTAISRADGEHSVLLTILPE